MVSDHADQARRLIVAEAQLYDFRSYARLELELEPGLVLVTGRNGAGKTNLVEAIHVATQGFSFRTRAEALLIRRGATAAGVGIRGTRGEVRIATDVRIDGAGPKRIAVNGATGATVDDLRRRIHTLVFTPDRLAVVKGGPATRRAYFDRVVGRLFPARASVPLEFGAAVGQRNAALRRVVAGQAGRESLDPWTDAVVRLGDALVSARLAAVEALQASFETRAAELGLLAATLAYAGEPPTRRTLDDRIDRDLERGTTGAGPHLHDVGILAGDRELRTLGSQGEQRLAVLSLLLAEAQALCDRGEGTPLLLLDDALSELDADRRQVLSERLGSTGQTVVTATGAEALPLAPAQLLEVAAGTVRAR